MSLFCVVAGLLGHAAALEPMGVSDFLGVPSVNANVAGSSGARSKVAKPSGGACLPICYTQEHKAWSVKCAWAERCKGCDECTGAPSDAAKAGAAAAAEKAGARAQGDEVFVGGPSDLGSGDTSTSAPDVGSGEPSANGAAPEGECADGFSRSYAGANCAGGAGSAWESEHDNTGCDCTGGVCKQCCKEEVISDDGAFNCTWAAPRTCFEPEASFVADDGCSEGYSRTYTGSNCVGTEAWEAANGNNACECTDGVCAKCCKEECNANGTHTCSWQEPKTCFTSEYDTVDEACADGFSRSYAGANCAGGAGSAWESEHGNTGCDCTNGVCKQCCKEECTEENTHVCYWEAPQTCVSTDDQPVDDHCPTGYTRAYAGVNCAGGVGSAWEIEHGDTGCDCTDGVCAQCCKEECYEDNTHACAWAPVKTCFSNEGQPADEACPVGFSRTYIGTNCALTLTLTPALTPTLTLTLTLTLTVSLTLTVTLTLTLTLTPTLTLTLTRHQLRGHGGVAGRTRQLRVRLHRWRVQELLQGGVLRRQHARVLLA